MNDRKTTVEKFTAGTAFITGSGAMQRRDTLHQRQVSNVRSGALYQTWCRLREPFMIPSDVTNHSCEGHWEKFDVDKAACMACSKIHVCNSLKCDTVCGNDGSICTITGLFLTPRLLSQYETPSDPICNEDPFISKVTHHNRKKRALDSAEGLTYHAASNRHKIIEPPSTDTESIMRMICTILLSPTTQQSINSEGTKMDTRLRTICLRRMRQYQMRRETPNICDIEAHLHFKINGHRTPPPSVEQSHAERLKCAHKATTAITQLLHFMRTHCGNVPTCVKHGGIVTGMLYMMRTGVTIDDITVLPRIPELKRLLPMEQHLMSFFNIRPKIVTEAENVIKYHLRNVAISSLALLAQTQYIVRTT
jgi:UL92 family